MGGRQRGEWCKRSMLGRIWHLSRAEGALKRRCRQMQHECSRPQPDSHAEAYGSTSTEMQRMSFQGLHHGAGHNLLFDIKNVRLADAMGRVTISWRHLMVTWIFLLGLLFACLNYHHGRCGRTWHLGRCVAMATSIHCLSL